MAGRARHRALTEELERRVQEAFSPDPDDSDVPSGLDYVCHRVEAGTTTKKLAKELEDSLHFPLDYAGLMRYLRQQYGNQATDHAIDEARTRSSHGHAEDSIDIVDEKAETSQEVTRAANRAKARQWLASRYNPKYGQQTQTTVNVSIGSLHLTAMKQSSPNDAAATLIDSGPRARLIGPASVAEAVTTDALDNTHADVSNTQDVVAHGDSETG